MDGVFCSIPFHARTVAESRLTAVACASLWPPWTRDGALHFNNVLHMLNIFRNYVNVSLHVSVHVSEWFPVEVQNNVGCYCEGNALSDAFSILKNKTDHSSHADAQGCNTL